MIRVAYTGTREPSASPKGVDVSHVPALRVEALESVGGRVERALDSAGTAVVFSRNAVRMLADSECADTLASREDVDWWAVGPKTARALANRLGLRARYPEGANSDALVSALGRADVSGPVVKLSIEGKNRDLSGALPDDAAVRDVPVYRTVLVPPEELADGLRAHDPEWVAVASAKGARAVDAAVERLAGGDDLRWAAIGSETAEAIRDLGRDVDARPGRPGVETMLQAISEHEQ